MITKIAAGFGLVMLAAMPAVADGYETGHYQHSGPSPLQPHAEYVPPAAHTTYERDVQVTRFHSPAPTTSCASCCYTTCSTPVAEPTHYSPPAVTKTYTRTYTRLAPPDCYHPNTGTHTYHGSTSSYQTAPTYSSSDTYYDGASYGYESDYAYDEGYYAGGEVYDENSVVWSSGGEGAYYETGPIYDSGYNYNVGTHNDRDRAWAHYDHGWKH